MTIYFAPDSRKILPLLTLSLVLSRNAINEFDILLRTCYNKNRISHKVNKARISDALNIKSICCWVFLLTFLRRNSSKFAINQTSTANNLSHA